MTDKQILKLTLEEYGYELDNLMFTHLWLEIAVLEAMERAKKEHTERIIKQIDKRTEKIGMFFANETKSKEFIRKVK